MRAARLAAQTRVSNWVKAQIRKEWSETKSGTVRCGKVDGSPTTDRKEPTQATCLVDRAISGLKSAIADNEADPVNATEEAASSSHTESVQPAHATTAVVRLLARLEAGPAVSTC
jgi:hypothetical protein